MANNFSTIGKRISRADGLAKVSGKALYGADMILPGTLWGKAVRSPFAHARILKVDTSPAKSRRGVLAVLTAEDLPDILIGRHLRDMRMLALDRVRFIGEKVAVVAAEDPYVAEEAAALLEVEYEELPAVYDPQEAMQEGAPIIHEHMASYEHLPQPPSKLPNVHSELRYSIGNLEKGFKQAKYVFENTFRTQLVHQGYLEPHAATVAIDSSGRVQVWASHKMPYSLRRHLADAAGIPEEKIVVHLVPIGGDFGGKGSLMDVPLCYFLAKKTSRPVKMVMSYAEEMMAANPRHPSVITIKSGVTDDGRICAQKVRTVLNSGAYGALKPTAIVNLPGTANGSGAYSIPNVAIESYSVYTNCVPCGYMRGPGELQTAFAVESHVDMMACKLGVNPLEFRRRNALNEGDLLPTGHRLKNVRSRETIEAAIKASTWGKRSPRPNVGRGVAVFHRHVAQGQSNAEVILLGDGRVKLVTTIPDTGTGAHTIMRQIVAETLTVPVDSVTVEVGNTDTFLSDSGAGGSRVSQVAGQATLLAASAAKEELLRKAAATLALPVEKVALERGYFYAADNPKRTLSFKGLAHTLSTKGEEVRARKTFESRRKHSGDSITCFVAQVAEVEVDRETGEVRVLKIVTAQDAGTILNPLTHQGQIDGGLIQGLGFALCEELKTEDGRISSLSLGDFKLPNIRDIPDLKTVLLEDADGPIPFDGKPIGEHSITPVAPVIANAIFDAVGVRITELPITAEKVYAALQRKAV